MQNWAIKVPFQHFSGGYEENYELLNQNFGSLTEFQTGNLKNK
jgi:hypothetical protein